MKIRTYTSPAAFKAALEERLRTSAGSGAEFARSRQLAAPVTSSRASANGPPRRTRVTWLYFKKRLLRQVDAITRESDLFGRVTEDTVRSYRRAAQQWKKIADRTHSDETIFKYTQ